MKALSTLLLTLMTSTAFAGNCDLPFQAIVSPLTGKNFSQADIYNNLSTVKEMYRNRYLVVNLDSADASGRCKGLNEFYPDKTEWPATLFPELNTTNGAATYRTSVLKYHRPPVKKGSVVAGACIGQTVSLCELRGNQAIEVAQLGTSSLNGAWGIPRHTYYSEMNYINTRSWDIYSRAPYNQSLDGPRDIEMGGIDESRMSGHREVWYGDEGHRYAMPNFMNFVPAPGFTGNSQNGLHEISGGETLASNLGAPVSHGCLRLTRYGAILMRWWIPRGARMFIHFTDSGYRRSARVDGTAGNF